MPQPVLVTFKTKSYANITMLGKVGMNMLEMMKFGVNVPGGIVSADLPEALDNLLLALEAVPKEAAPEHDADDDQAKVSLHTRALPLIKLLQAAIADKNNIRWE